MGLYKKVHPTVFKSITFFCPVLKKDIVVDDWAKVLIGGMCANEEYPHDHNIEVDCECGNAHEMVGKL